MIPDEGNGAGNSVSIDVQSLEALSSQLKTLLGVTDRHRDLSESGGIPWDLPLWTRLPQTRSFRGQTTVTCGQAFEVIEALDELCAKLQSATDTVAKDFTHGDQFTSDELRALGDQMGSHQQDGDE